MEMVGGRSGTGRDDDSRDEICGGRPLEIHSPLVFRLGDHPLELYRW